MLLKVSFTGCADSAAGLCVNSPGCSKRHDRTRTALCPSVLARGGCIPKSMDSTCRLQHSSSPKTLPTCFHFLNGQCLRSSCAFSHSRVDLDVLVCPDFGLLGYCERGFDCRMSHLRWCPDFFNAGRCKKLRCSLQHRTQNSAAKRRGKSSRAAGKGQEQHINGSKTNEFSAQHDYVSLE